MTKLITLPIALFALAAAQAPAHADEDMPKTRIVPYGDLDLTQPRDVATLHHRISNAIIAVCDYASPTSLHALGVQAWCRKETAKRMEIQVAEAVRGGRSARVSIADLDLGRPQGRQVLRQRLGIAVAQACGSPMGRERPVNACRAELRHQLPATVTRVAADGAGPLAG